MFSQGLPLDLVIISRFSQLVTGLLPRALANWAAERTVNERYDHRLYGLQPNHR